MSNQKQVVIVDTKDRPLGSMDFFEAHRTARLHRAISVFLFNSRGEWLLQKRSNNIEHSQGMWSNTCSTHPEPGEACDQAALKYLSEEYKINDVHLMELYSFIYLKSINREFYEHEFDHVYIGFTNEKPIINSNMIDMFSYQSGEDLAINLRNHPDDYTFWLHLIAGRLVREMASKHIFSMYDF